MNRTIHVSAYHLCGVADQEGALGCMYLQSLSHKTRVLDRGGKDVRNSVSDVTHTPDQKQRTA